MLPSGVRSVGETFIKHAASVVLAAMAASAAAQGADSGPDPWWRHGRGATPTNDPYITEPRLPQWVTPSPWRSYASLHGRIDIGWGRALHDTLSLAADCPAGQQGLRPGARSHVGFRIAEPLAGGWQASARLLQEFDADTGAGSCGVDEVNAWSRQGLAALSHRRWGEFQIGWRDVAARLITLDADPWHGDGVASPSALMFAVAQTPALKAARSLTYAYQLDDRWRVELQAAGATEGVPASHGAAAWVRHGVRHGVWLFGAGWHRWETGDRLAPLAVGLDTDRWRADLAVTIGQREGARERNAFVGLRWRHEFPQRGEWRIGLDRMNSELAGRSGTQVSAGYWRPFWAARHTAWYANATRRRVDDSGSASAFEIGVRHQFEHPFARDMRLP